MSIFSGEKKKEKKQKEVDSLNNFLSPSCPASVPDSVDRELVRSVVFFGDTDSFRETSRRIQIYPLLDSATKRAVRDRRRHLLELKQKQPEKLEFLREQYSIPSLQRRKLSSDFNQHQHQHHPPLITPPTTKAITMEFGMKSLTKYNGKFFKLSLLLLFKHKFTTCFLPFLKPSAMQVFPSILSTLKEERVT